MNIERSSTATIGRPAAATEGSTIQKLRSTLTGPLVRLLGGVHPNTITVFALITGCAAGLSYWLTRYDPLFFLLGGALVAVSGVGDVLDGDVARHYGRTSALGDFLDHFLDRVVNISILGGLAFSPHASTATGLAVTILVLLNSYLGTQIEASFGTRSYTGLGKLELFVGLVVGSVVLAFAPQTSLTIAGRAFTLLELFFVAVGVLTVPAMAHRLLLARNLAAQTHS